MRRWVGRVQETSNAMDLPRGIATGLQPAVLRGRRTKGRSKLQSAISMLDLPINRSGRNLGRADRARLGAATDELRRAFGRPPRSGRAAGARRRRSKAA